MPDPTAEPKIAAETMAIARTSAFPFTIPKSTAQLTNRGVTSAKPLESSTDAVARMYRPRYGRRRVSRRRRILTGRFLQGQAGIPYGTPFMRNRKGLLPVYPNARGLSRQVKPAVSALFSLSLWERVGVRVEQTGRVSVDTAGLEIGAYRLRCPRQRRLAAAAARWSTP